ncbi:MAG TPA: hypothetical protein DC058_10825, partial [Planctomycetaceae bacterium]|nr:hypothetical protein [Planctomycetaceae bacterium]HBC61698.1 hypothetical protein [Planctomycetaceae bacterium]
MHSEDSENDDKSDTVASRSPCFPSDGPESEPTVRDFSALLPPNTVACLKLANDGRRFPFRPLTAGHCLIGSGAACDLRLGEAGVPSLHSSIELNGTAAARITLLASAPTLCINGQAVSHADLRDGDLLEIGDFRAVFHFCLPTTDATAPPVHRHEELAVRKQLLELAASARSAASESDSAMSESQLFGDEHEEDTEPDADDLLLRLDLLDRRMDDSARALKELVRQQRIVADVLQRMA